MSAILAEAALVLSDYLIDFFMDFYDNYSFIYAQ
jgi:hypothetical protein